MNKRIIFRKNRFRIIIESMPFVKMLIEKGILKTPSIIRAFELVNRENFVLPEEKQFAKKNRALSIGFEQTISQPLVVAFMLEQLKPKKGDKILDIGSGSGWTSALLGEIVRPNGKVIAIELILELKKFGEENIAKYGLIEEGIVKFVCGDGAKGYSEEAPFDKILCSASAEKKIPFAWKKQLKIGGKIVAPIGSSIWLFIKKSEEEFEEIEYPGYVFVPLIEENK